MYVICIPVSNLRCIDRVWLSSMENRFLQLPSKMCANPHASCASHQSKTVGFASDVDSMQDRLVVVSLIVVLVVFSANVQQLSTRLRCHINNDPITLTSDANSRASVSRSQERSQTATNKEMYMLNMRQHISVLRKQITYPKKSWLGALAQRESSMRPSRFTAAYQRRTRKCTSISTKCLHHHSSLFMPSSLELYPIIESDLVIQSLNIPRSFINRTSQTNHMSVWRSTDVRSWMCQCECVGSGFVNFLQKTTKM